LLIAPFNPPASRHLILAKVDESLEIEGKKYNLYTNISKNYISEGYKHQEAFEKDYLPTFHYKIEKVKITKTISMEHGKNTVAINYIIKNSDKMAKLILAPLLNYRDYHNTSTNIKFNLSQEIEGAKLKVTINDNKEQPIYISVPDSKYIIHNDDSFNNMFYVEEEKRGFISEENHAIPGVFEISIEPNEKKEISFVCSLEKNIEKKKAKDIIENEISRLEKVITKTKLIENKENKTAKQENHEELIKQLVIATDNFVTYKPTFDSYTLMAGYPWFIDWSRDTLIAFEGILLLTRRNDLARKVLISCAKDINSGLIPNGYSDNDNTPLYNSVDASLLLFEQVQKYLEYTNDYKFVKENLYEKLKSIIENYACGIDLDNNNIYLDYDNLIVSGTEETQNTWMDAKYNGKAITPRNGKVVEINALWYNALKIMADLENKIGKKANSKQYKELAERTKLSFNNEFYNKKRKCLYDVIGDSKIRPNQLFALSLTYPVVDPKSEIAQNILDVVTKKLLNNYGLKTLAKGEENYVEVYEGDGFKRDSSYHQGITWVWLLGLYYNTLKNMINAQKTKKAKENLEKTLSKFVKNVEATFTKEINTGGCIGGIAELYDSKKPHLPKGTINQAWSVAEVFRIIAGK